ncbi:sulfatase family protein [Pelagicoccus mobilis]|uniref:Sulfatase n=1 Tax=Pelagicoccus mobilis TaxID=415221 RepID=A0A934VPQ8_9BACT|nr:sulfatase [Pelagicoccus mobilis]MBK1875783.1 sulfatase [Pelagicoccus mobilis]
MKTAFLFASAILWAAFGFGKTESQNVIIIFTDDQGYQDLGCYGSPNISTPRIDQMAKEGMLFTDFYVASSVCSPSRAALLTGKYPAKLGINSVFWPNQPGGLDPEELTIAEMLKEVGYATMAVGKWHLGDKKEYLPTNQGFDAYYGIPYSNDMSPALDMVYDPDCLYRDGFSLEKAKEIFAKADDRNPPELKNKVPLMRDDVCIEIPVDQRTITKRFTDEGMRFISESVEADRPFFLYLAHSMPHTPLHVSKDFEGKSERSLYGDVIEEIDYNTGRLLDHLKALGVERDTLVIYSSDNGPWLNRGDHGGSALPLSKGKKSHFEGGHRVPGVMRWPARIPAGRVCSEVATTIDLLPTLAVLNGISVDGADLDVDGKDISRLMFGVEGEKTPHRHFFYKRAAVRSGDWKYHQVPPNPKRPEKAAPKPALYNLKNDISESRNVINEYPEIAERLQKALMEHVKILENYD